VNLSRRVRGATRAVLGLGLLAACALPLDAWAAAVAVRVPRGLVDALRFFDSPFPMVQQSLAILMGGVMWARRRDPVDRAEGLALALAPMLTNLAVSALKLALARPRPYAADVVAEAVTGIETAAFESFPSGHVAGTAAVLAAFALRLGLRHPLTLVWMGILPVMAFSRMAFGVHYLSDTAAGASAGVAMAAAAFAIAPALARRARLLGSPLVLLWLALAVSWLARDRTAALDPGTGQRLEGFSLRPRWARILLEPFCGPPLEWAYAPDPRRFVAAVGLALALLILLVLVLPRAWTPGQRLRAAGALLLLAGIHTALAATGLLPADRFHADRPGLFVDLHVHADDPVDGAFSAERQLAEARARNIAIIAFTNHDAPPPPGADLPGLEWSAYVHPLAPMVHLLVLGGRQSLPRLLALGSADAREGRLADPGAAFLLAREAVRIAKEEGAVVLVAHLWRTRAAMGDQGSRLPEAGEWAALGVDGFEVGNRHPHPSEIPAEVAAIDALCREQGLLRISTSDDHGIPAGSPCVTFLPGEFPPPGPERREAVFRQLAARGPAQPLVFSRGPGSLPWWMEGPLTAWRYLVAMPGPCRLSWALWGLACALALSWRRRLR
jgi:membrane-associated phospholipid phosphatase